MINISNLFKKKSTIYYETLVSNARDTTFEIEDFLALVGNPPKGVSFQDSQSCIERVIQDDILYDYLKVKIDKLFNKVVAAETDSLLLLKSSVISTQLKIVLKECIEKYLNVNTPALDAASLLMALKERVDNDR